MSSPGASGMVTDCSAEAYVLAVPAQGGKSLHSTGSELDTDGSPGPDLFLDLVTSPAVSWSRTYNVGRGTSGTFNGCFGETFGANGYNGNLWIFFETSGGQKTVRFLWHFDYYVTPGNTSREHYTLKSGKIPFVAWTGGNVSSRVFGPFLIEHYHKEGRTIRVVPVVSNLTLDFNLSIERAVQ
ncbi:MAG TPA: hypothetical protein VNC59_05290 [Thermoanaerobaculia bacterium]|nr:hypothetical protein [Thermoanaerobaculia bacterium]